VLNGIVLIAEFNRLEKEGFSDITERVLKGLHTRLRPVIITAAVASLGFLPMALSTSAGAEVQKPLATVVIGGLITATLLTLIVLPIFYIFFSTDGFKKLSDGLKKLFKQKSGVTALVILLLASTATVNAQKTQRINLKQAIQMALDSNLSVRSSVYSVDAQKALKGAAWDIPKTNIDGQFGQFNSYSKDNSFTVSQSFAFPTVYANQHKLANANVKSSEWELKTSQLEIATQVKQVYRQLAYLLSKQKLFLWQDSLYSGFQRAAELRTKTGETNHLEMITARSQAMEVRNQLQQVNADILIFNQKLQVLLNTNEYVLPADTVLQRTDFLPNSNSMVSGNPQLGFALQQIELSRIETKLEKSKLLPDLNVGYLSQTIRGDQTINGVPRTFGLGNRFTALQAGIAVPLWFGSNTAKIKAAKLKEKVTQYSAENYSKSLSGSYRSLMLEFSKNSNSI
jgi:cobalt-zinc-cadmium resistance protein CzcA